MNLILLRRSLLVLVLSLACWSVQARAGSTEAEPWVTSETEPASPTALPTSYVLGSGDSIKVDVYGEPDLSGVFEVYESGQVDFPLVGRIQLGGLAVPDAAELLSERLAERFLVDPHVTLQLERYGSQPVQVLGAVAQPGVVYLQGPTTLRQMLALVGGVIAEKAVKEVRLQRGANGGAQVTVVKLDRLLADGEGDLLLQGGDVVNVVEGMVVYVSGEVEKSGTVPFWDGLTVTRALAEAGGPTNFAKLREAYVMRDGERISFNLKRLLQGRETDIVLQAGDQLVIEESMF